MKHIPVMLTEVCDALNIMHGGTYADITYGCGGYSNAIYKQSGTKVYASDRDLHAVNIGLQDSNVIMKHARFSDLEFAPRSLDGIVADLGLSTPQITQNDRGFSFMKNGPLDMQMGICDRSALELIRKLPEARLAQILKEYGEEPKSKIIAKAIYTNRETINTTLDLVNIVSKLTFHKGRNPATRTFQALRIAVNNELDELEYVLYNASRWLKKGGRLVIVTFHSLEDRMVKFHLKKSWAKSNRIFPTDEEVSKNPCARSAKLRWGEME